MKPNIEEKDGNGITPLIACFTDGEESLFDKTPNLEVVKFLIKKGANPNVLFNFTEINGHEMKVSLIEFVDNQITKYEDEAFYDEEMVNAYKTAYKLLKRKIK